MAVRDPRLFDNFTVNADAFIMLKGYAFRFTKEAANYVPEPDFVPFLWRRHEKDDDARGSEEGNRDGSKAQEPPKSVDGDTQMPQAPETNAPQTTSVGLIDPAVVLRNIAVTPINPKSRTHKRLRVRRFSLC